jgi:hypothetical protein
MLHNDQQVMIRTKGNHHHIYQSSQARYNKVEEEWATRRHSDSTHY